MGKLKFIILSSLAIFGGFLPSMAHAASPSRWDDGNIIFATATVGGIAAFTADEKDVLIASLGGQVVFVTPTFYEVAITTTLGKFSSWDDFNKTMTSQSYILDKVQAYATERAANERLATDFPAYATIMNNKNKKLTAKINILVALAGTL